LLENLGKSELGSISGEIYGKSGDVLTATPDTTSIDAAQFFLRVAEEFSQEYAGTEAEFCLPASTVRTYLESQLADVLGANATSIDLDRNLTSKAAAGATRVRDATCFRFVPIMIFRHERNLMRREHTFHANDP
jgi:hypothetical protein